MSSYVLLVVDEHCHIPKSKSMPLRQILPDPFPEISHSAQSTTTTESSASSDGSRSSPSSPITTRVYSPDSPKKRAIDRSSGRYSLARSESADVSIPALKLKGFMKSWSGKSYYC